MDKWILEIDKEIHRNMPEFKYDDDQYNFLISRINDLTEYYYHHHQDRQNLPVNNYYRRRSEFKYNYLKSLI